MASKSSTELKSGTRNPSPSSEAALKRMLAAKPRDTAPEKALRSALHNKGLRFRIDQKPIKELNRRADIVFRSAKVAVFVDGCFWHGCPIHGTQAKANAEFWRNKIEQNQMRDLDTNAQLKKAGWRIVRVWEHDDPQKASQNIYRLVMKRTRNNASGRRASIEVKLNSGRQMLNDNLAERH
jgi:DNA mismatch endonuclease, patch repair protein